MSYLLIAFIIFVVLSPLAWMKGSPSQTRVTAFRARARELGIKVQLVADADAEATEKKPVAVRYFLPFGFDSRGSSLVASADWTLIRQARRGMASPWAEWRWFRHEAPEAACPIIAQVVNELPAAVTAIRMEAAGVSVYLRESGELETVDHVYSALKQLILAR